MPVIYSEKEIHKAFIDPIRSVLLIDDAYPRYEEVADSLTGTALPEHLVKGLPGARATVKLFRDMNLICDVENRPNHILEGVLQNIGKSDLVVLDFHLRRTDHDNTTEALQILGRLADSPHGNLVIVHTSDQDLDGVKLKVAGYLRGYLHQQPTTEEVAAAIATWQPDLSFEIVEQHLTRGASGWKGNVNPLRKQLTELGVPHVAQTVVISNSIEDFLRKNGAPARQEMLAPLQKMRFSPRGAQHKWLSFKNVFVSFVSKGKDEAPAKNMFDELVISLKESSPTLLRMLLTHAKTKLEQGGFSYEDEILNSPDSLVHTAWLFQLIESKEDGTVQLDELLARMFASLQPELIKSVIEETAGLVSEIFRENASSEVHAAPSEGKIESGSALQGTHCQAALELAGAGTAATADILHALNSYLSLEQIYPRKLTSGTIFARANEASDPEVCWVCVTASCDMEPREPGDEQSWHREIYPTKSVLTLKLSKTTVHSALQGATFYRSLFVPLSEKRLAFRIMEEDVRQPRTQLFFVTENAKLDQDGEFAAYSVKKGAAEITAIELHLDKYKVIAQLRAPYADRLLQEAGHHSSRIGVDFVNLLAEKQRGSKKEKVVGPPVSSVPQAGTDEHKDDAEFAVTTSEKPLEPPSAPPPAKGQPEPNSEDPPLAKGDPQEQ